MVIDSPIGNVTGVILAGGKSSRYGRNKALEEINGIRLIEKVIDLIRSVFHRLIIITNTPHEYDYLQLSMYEDLIKGLGPLGGIYTGLQAIVDEAGFFVACDMPFLNIDLIRHQVRVWDDFDAVVPRIDWKIETLHTLYVKQCLFPIKELIDMGECQILQLMYKIRVRYVDEDEVRGFDPQLRSFFNINRPQDLLSTTD